ncbi:hypothetical protein M9H77_17011 [Catharanthus roseus]|uniref:Uncharacterized protein n=1 Tax=Catharanthus roseus TaxID=4058 RepID=A0ACC0B3E4_CATRO|nr:hypothetical protein M9H77_17011 [Catharanthus roseus]
MEEQPVVVEPTMWLPPINSHLKFYTLILAKQSYVRVRVNPALVVLRPAFSISISITVKFYPENSTRKRSFMGLSLDHTYQIPCWHITSLSPMNAVRFILDLINRTWLCFQLKNIFLRWKHFDEGGNICWEDGDVYGVLEKIWYFLCTMSRKSYNQGRNELPFSLEIMKIIQIPHDQFRDWNSWYRQKKRANPYFEREFKNAIRRPRTPEELLEPVLYDHIATSESAIQELETLKFGESGCSSTADTNCLVCLQKLQIGSIACRLPCSHLFHKDCVIKWLQESHMCPLCRFKFPLKINRSNN